MLPKSCILVPNNYYVVVGVPSEKEQRLGQEEIMVFYTGSKLYVERDDGKDGPEIKHTFLIVAHLTPNEEGAPEIGTRELLNDEDLSEMSKYDIYIREATDTELVLYGRSGKT